ncbi:MAG TPA: ABC transporter permease [Micrococcaceae bacterium]|jgi:ABC-2 type transport system permease protein|nr:ABC transporter permease [Micrococcaceae bacterium]
MYYLRLEIIRMLRDPKYLALAVAAPIGFYLLFASLFGDAPVQPGQLKGTVEIMVAMAAYGAIWAVLSTTAPRIAEERQIGWLDQVRAMPIGPGGALGAKVAASAATALPAIVLVCLTAAVAKGVQLSAGQWIALVAAMWAGSTVFAALGIAIGYTISADAAYPVTYGLYMALSAIGGLWVPPAILPQTMRNLAQGLPTYRLADLGWRIAEGQPPTAAAVLVLLAWAAGLGLVAYLAFLRPRVGGRLAGRRGASRPDADLDPEAGRGLPSAAEAPSRFAG